MLTIILAGILSAIAIIVVMFRIGMKKFAGYPAFCDAAVTIGLGLILFGTYSGMIAAIVGGLCFSAFLTIYRKTVGYEKLTIKGWKVVKDVKEYESSN